MVIPSFNVVIIANVFIAIVLVDYTVDRSAVDFFSTSIAVPIARLPWRRKYSYVNIEGPDFAVVPPLDLETCCNISKG
jgi:hypothetical protein